MIAAIVGTWELVGRENRYDDGSVSHPDARGLLVYTPDGRMTAQWSMPGRTRFASGDIRKGSPAELEAAFTSYLGYFGRYEWRQEEGVVLHHVEGSLFPNWEGTVLRRGVSLEGDELRLSTPPLLIGGRMMTSVIVWRRARPSAG
jgi:hypothetical protein